MSNYTVGEEPRVRLRRRIALVMAFLATAWSAVELGGLVVVDHTTGPEIYGLLVAALAVASGALTTVLLASSEARPWLVVLVLLGWAVVAIGGVGGTIAHIVGPGVGHGPIDPRERPIGAPLVFTAIGLMGSAALVWGRRMGIRRLLESMKG